MKPNEYKQYYSDNILIDWYKRIMEDKSNSEIYTWSTGTSNLRGNLYTSYTDARYSDSHDAILIKLFKLYETIISKTTNNRYSYDLYTKSDEIIHDVEKLRTYSNTLKFILVKFEKLVEDGYFLNNSEYKKFIKLCDTDKYDGPGIFIVILIIDFLYRKRKYKHTLSEHSLIMCNKFWNLFNSNETIYKEDLINIFNYGLEKNIYDI